MEWTGKKSVQEKILEGEWTQLAYLKLHVLVIFCSVVCVSLDFASYALPLLPFRSTQDTSTPFARSQADKPVDGHTAKLVYEFFLDVKPNSECLGYIFFSLKFSSWWEFYFGFFLLSLLKWYWDEAGRAMQMNWGLARCFQEGNKGLPEEVDKMHPIREEDYYFNFK